VGRTERLPQGRDLDRQIAFLHDRAGPSPFHQICLGDDPASSVEQCFEKRQAALADSDRFAVPQQPAAGIKDERAERVSRLHHAL
jgi:hypothetical protein